MSRDYSEKLRDAILDLDTDLSRELAEKALASGADPVALITDGIRPALDIMGERFSEGVSFLPELMIAGRAADAAVAVIEPEMLRRGVSDEVYGRFLIATVKDDIHDIGKNIVALLMKSSGFEVINLGVDKSSEEILAAAEEHQVDVIGLSTLLTTTMAHITEFMDLLTEKGVRDKYRVIVGGAPLSAEFAEKIGADGFAPDAPQAVELVRKLLRVPA